MDKIEETYQKLIDKIVQFEDENKDLFAVANGMEIMYDCRIPFPFLGLKKTTRRAMEFISKASSSEFLFKKVSSVTFVCYGEYSHKCIDKSIEYHRPQLRILFEGDTGQWGYKKIGQFWHDIHDDKSFDFQCFWAYSSGYIRRSSDSIMFLTWVVKQLPWLKAELEKIAAVKRAATKAKAEYNDAVCKYALSVLN